jgi:prolyl 4-hydroxylase
MQLSDYIKTYDNVIPKEVRDSLIKKFALVAPTREFDEHTYKFKEVFIQNHLNIFQDEFNFAFKGFNQCVEKYKQELRIKFFPDKHGYEIFRLKKYNSGNGHFKPHVDVYGTNSMMRFFTFFCYINDGGGTKFTDLDITIESKPGRLLCFPPMWMFPHEAIVSDNCDKYLLHTYLHYV